MKMLDMITLTFTLLLGLTTAAEGCADVACPQGFPVCDEGETLIDVGQPGDCCPVYECVGQACTPGDSYYTLPDNPCRYCTCESDGEATDNCTERVCDPPVCPAGQWPKPIPGTCCGFEQCAPQAGCADVACPAGFPSCSDGTLVDRREPGACCPDYVCVQPVCIEGEYYTLPDNLCKDCVCGEDGHPTDDCREIACSPIYCPPGTTRRNIEGMCCGQECVDSGSILWKLNWTGMIVLVVGAVLLL